MFSASKTAGPSGYNINNSLRFRASASAYLSRTPASAGNRQKFTLSVWIKLGQLSTNKILLSSNTTAQQFRIYTDNTIGFGNSGVANYQSTGVLRDPSAWYHIVCKVDTTLASGKIVIYVNNQAYLTTDGGLSLNANTQFNNTVAHFIGRDTETPNQMFFDGYMAEYNFIDGQALTPSSFGSTNATTGVWQPKAYTGTYGTNGFYLKFSDIATTSGSNAGLGKDFSGNANYWTTNNISVTSGTTYDAMTDSPTNTSATVANYATLNYIDTNTASSISGANLNWVDAGGIDREIRGTIGVSSGKYYWEVVLTSSNTSHVGVDTLNSTLLTDYLGSTSTSWSIYLATGNKRNAGSNTSYGSSLAANDIMMCALDMDNGKIWWGKNGTWFASGDPAAGTNAAFTNLSGYTIAFAATPRSSCSVNFGQRPFSYTPPTGFNRLNTYNLPNSTIVKGNTVMDATLWTGDGTSSRSITNAALFRPDFVWIKNRSRDGADPYYGVHMLFNTVTGAGNRLMSQSTTSEIYSASSLTAFNSNGFSVGSDLPVNRSGDSFVGWQWQAGQGTTSSNTQGSITSTVSVNATAGFSVVTFTATGSNATVGHGLGVAPKMIITKQRNVTGSWATYHESLGNTKLIYLDSTGAALGPSSAYWNNTSPTSTVFTFGGALASNTNTIVAYCWAEIAGFSKFGSYTGNGSADGPMIFTGFQPKYILIKSTATANSWRIIDTARNPYNTANSALWANESTAEATGSTHAIDILSNGFKIRNSTSETNNSGTTLIYAAFASNPFKNSNAF